MNIGIYGSCRNEERNLDDWFASIDGADFIALNDTGSTDDTFEKARAIESERPDRIRVERKRVEPMLLSNALNVAMSLLPDDIDLAIRLDLDERLAPGWRDAIERVEITGPTVLQPWFDHHGCLYRHDRIHSRRGFHWELPVHEVLLPDRSMVYTRLPVDATIEHHQDLTKDRSQVLGELERAVAAEPNNLRLIHYLGREYTYYARWADAIPHLYAHATSGAYAEERSESWRLLHDCYMALLPLEHVSLVPISAAIETCRVRREPWVTAAEYHYRRGSWHTCRYTAKKALAITERCNYFNQPWAWGPRPHDLAALACHYTGRRAEAIEHGRAALELAPDDERLAENLAWYEGRRA